MSHLPGAAVVAATALCGTGTATVTSAETGEQVGVVHARTAAGEVVVLLTADGAARLGAEGGPDVAVRLEVVVEAALPDLTVPRAQLVLDGWLAPLADADVGAALDATCALGDLAELHAHWPDAVLAAVEPAAARLHWPEGCTDVPVEDLARAVPDPVTLREGHVLARVEAELGDRLVGLVQGMGHVHPAPGGAGSGAPSTGRDLARVEEVRCVGADRHGLVLRCRTSTPWAGQVCCAGASHGDAPCAASTTASLRLLFPSPVADADAAVDALALLVLGASASDPARCPYAPGRRPA
ncbi:hypothetical protein WDZ17_04985 [Pseudokineococcus basanitobsidens]|uniref:Uncharacterized protein n=1 Tax=Pseudokineococcus basanitobsidens TaxID=1926649 RepID=A0ABU8RHS7_9ACTN